MERWKEIKDYEGIYEVSSAGRVRSLPTIQHFVQGTAYVERFFPGKVLKGYKNTNGYIYVDLHKDGSRIKRYIHQLVAEAFCEGYAEGFTVNHKNYIRTDNRAENLEWMSIADNLAYSNTAINLPDNGRSVVQMDDNGNIIAKYRTIKDASKSVGVSSTRIIYVCKGIYQHSAGYVWRYDDNGNKESERTNEGGVT